VARRLEGSIPRCARDAGPAAGGASALSRLEADGVNLQADSRNRKGKKTTWANLATSGGATMHEDGLHHVYQLAA